MVDIAPYIGKLTAHVHYAKHLRSKPSVTLDKNDVLCYNEPLGGRIGGGNLSSSGKSHLTTGKNGYRFPELVGSGP